MMDDLRATIKGAALIADWLGEGGTPVPVQFANRRSAVCANCPQNKPGNWWEEHVNHPVAMAVRDQLEARNAMSLRLDNEDKVGVCRVCRCTLALKCFTPIAHILKHTTSEQLSQFDPNCWITKETA